MNPGFVIASAAWQSMASVAAHHRGLPRRVAPRSDDAGADNPTYGAIVIASAAWQSMTSVAAHHHGLPRRVAPRSDDAGAVIAICLCWPTETAY